MIAFDADVLIYAVDPSHPLGRRVSVLLAGCGEGEAVGSVALLPELLSKPLRSGRSDEVDALGVVLGHLTLHPVDEPTARLATVLGARYGLRAMDAIHLATAVACDASAFVTNNAKDFPTTITEIDIVYPAMLPTPA